ncbi:MAG: glycosyltransferase family 39 protein [Patescibacteria group bacterium]
MALNIRSFLGKKENLILLGILVLAAFLRLYRIADYMTFLGDEGRDVLTVKHILDGQFTLLGPRSSAADFYYGPIYFYMIAPFLFLFHYDPVGPAVFIGILGVITVFLLYKIGKEFFGSIAGLVAAALYAISPVIITYSHSSWNPNPLPFVSLLMLYTLYHGLKKPHWSRFGLVGFLLGIALQLQYIALFLVIIVGVYTTIGTFLEEKKGAFLKLLKRFSAVAAGFLVGFSPFLAFEFHHGFPNTKTIINFMLGKYTPVDAPPVSALGQVIEVFFKLFGRLITRFPEENSIHIFEKPDLMIWYISTLVLGLTTSILLFKIKDRLVKILFLCWLILGVGLFFLYKKEIFDYYLGFMFPLPFLIIGNSVGLLIRDKKDSLLRTVSIAIIICLIFMNLGGWPFRNPANRQKLQAQTIAEFVLQKAEGKPFNFALITPGNSDHAYRYFFEVEGNPPVTIQNPAIDPERKTVTGQLLVVCEEVNCHPLGHPLFEVASFGQADIVGEWNVSVVKVFKLIPYKGH